MQGRIDRPDNLVIGDAGRGLNENMERCFKAQKYLWLLSGRYEKLCFLVYFCGWLLFGVIFLEPFAGFRVFPNFPNTILPADVCSELVIEI